MTRLRVAHVCTVDLGLRYLLLNQLKSIQEDGYEVVGISAPGPNISTVEAAGIRCVTIPWTRAFSPVADLRATYHLWKVMRRERPAIVHTHTPKPGFFGQIAARLAGVPLVVNTLHGFYFHDNSPRHIRALWIAMEWIAARCSDVILSQNSEDIETAVAAGICSRDKIKFLGNGIDLNHFNRERISQQTQGALREEFGIAVDSPVVGFVGRLVAEKGVLDLLEAARIVLERQPHTRFLIVGPLDYDKPDALTPESAARFGVAEACVFAGVRHDMPEIYALMDVFALPSHREGFPRSPMEASAMGVPTVVTDIRGCREVVEQGRNGLRVPVRDPTALAAAILTLLGDLNLARKMGEDARHVARDRFDEQVVFARVRSEYRRLLTAKRLSTTGGSPRPQPQV